MFSLKCILVCCSVFNGMYLSRVLFFYWNVFNIYIQMLSAYTLIRFIEIKCHKN